MQNKLTIREKQKTWPGWLETLKSFFQPTTRKLAIAGSVAVILLLTFISLDQWKKQTFRPPVFESEKPVVEGKVDSVQLPAKDESEFRAIEQGKKTGLVDKKGPYLSAPKMAIDTLTLKPMANAPAASAPLGRVLAAPEEQKSKEEPTLAAFAERDEAVKGDTVVVTAGKKAEIRKEVATSQVKVAAEEIEKLPIRNTEGLLKVQAGVSQSEGQTHIRGGRKSISDDSLANTTGKKEETQKEADTLTNDISKLPIRNVTDLLKVQVGVGSWKPNEGIRGGGQPEQEDSLLDTVARKAKIQKEVATSQEKAVPKAPSTAKPFMTMPAVDTAQLVSDIRQIIAEKEKELKGELSRTERESLYIFLAQHYVQLYRFSLNQKDWEKANGRLDDFLKTDLSKTNRRWLVAIQAELKKLKK
ncbi:MAG TPA: hypothetical protein VNL73_11290 [Verrucomicrobiae bacterium]|nr:hypothetical protein [Verrucomicrobiae bacterium]